jgi:hypothetical protein
MTRLFVVFLGLVLPNLAFAQFVLQESASSNLDPNVCDIPSICLAEELSELEKWQSTVTDRAESLTNHKLRLWRSDENNQGVALLLANEFYRPGRGLVYGALGQSVVIPSDHLQYAYFVGHSTGKYAEINLAISQYSVCDSDPAQIDWRFECYIVLESEKQALTFQTPP